MITIIILFSLFIITGIIRVINRPYINILNTIKLLLLIDLLIETIYTIKDYLDID